MLPAPKLPLLTPAEAFGPDLERFKDPTQALVSWRDKQLQWWTFSGSLQTLRGRPYAFELKFIDRHTQNDFIGALPTRWLSARTLTTHFSLTDPLNGDNEKNFRCHERGGLFSKTSGFFSEDYFHLEVGGTHCFSHPDGTLTLAASLEDVSLHLTLEPPKKLIYHGQSGYVHRDNTNGPEASFYCSAPRLSAKGRLIIDGKLEEVTGSVWLDHEKFSGPTARTHHILDRITLQFETGECLMVFDHAVSPFATYIDPQQTTHHFVGSELKIENLEYWISKKTGARYAIKRKIRIEPLNREFELKPIVVDQEVNLIRGTFGCAWIGAIITSGGHGFMSISGTDTRPQTRALSFFVR